ncbi:Molybdopterin oxidoreductase membrane subunit [Melioribacter roseus P3M-2]|uniref:Molybdopterin oxidoreductase membrane subunit n=1 Tax=Melioribacter roseus (strain DSM 23840 / JCM 17771 / VKM B-2668 / P3M-2) TaxID=1191523 RepID=I6YRW2_MELRP|nr:NrfD/PsrC family molybdoenzyme membrane anchor subunit [Melioribacter roseus]AFN73287.1 Molybdopterin oxidoreductase membrane subunit [Melioribacter roseus P3M-2]
MSSVDYTHEASVIEGRPPLRSLDDLISKPLETKPDKKFYIALSVTLSMLGLFVIGLFMTFYYGIGTWGNHIPVAWGFGIVNFVFWVGIGHAGTLISAILFLFRQKWRTGIARFAEGMTIFAVMTAGIFPLIHTGRPWLAGYLFPYPNQHSIWVNFTSPLLWDVFAVSTYLTVSLIFWYVGLIPDFATLREKTSNKIKKVIYSIFSLGWRFSNRHWQHYEMVYLILAGFATPLVLSVHTIVSFDFAVSILPGWHTTIFPPYFVAGAVFSGFAMVQNVLIFVRKIFNYEHIITVDTLERMNKIILLTGSLVGYAYSMEFFIAWYSGVQPEQFTFINRAFGPYAWAYWIMVSCNVLAPQLFWFKKIRRTIPVMFVIAVFVNVGMWFERFVIVVTSLSRDYLPSSWQYFTPSLVDFMILIGSFGFFFTWILLFTKALPVVSIAEVKAVVDGAQPSHKEH